MAVFSGWGWEFSSMHSAVLIDLVVSQSMSATIIRSLQLSTADPRRQVVGGGTYAFDVWEGHPLYDDVMKLLESTRTQASSLRQAVQSYNSEHGLNEEVTRVSFYCGQHGVEGYTDE